MSVKRIKIMDGLKLITSDKIYRLKGAKDLWKALGWDIDNDEMASKCAMAVFQQLYCFGRADLTEFTTGKKTCIVEAIPADNFRIQYRGLYERRYKNFDDVRRFEDDAKEEVERLNSNPAYCPRLVFRVGRWE